MAPDISFDALHAIALKELAATRPARAEAFANQWKIPHQIDHARARFMELYALLDHQEANSIATRQRNEIASQRLKMQREFQENQRLERAYGSAAA